MTGMTSIRGVVVAAALGMMMLAPQAVAAQQMIDGSDPDQILNLARGYGSANLEKSDNGDPLIRGRIDGVGYAIFFNDCTNNRNCDTLGFYAGWTDTNVTEAHVAEWNRTKRFSRAYIDDEGDPGAAGELLDAQAFAQCPASASLVHGLAGRAARRARAWQSA